MAQIRTKTEVSYTGVNPLTTAKILIKIVEWKELQDGTYWANINYFAEQSDGTSIQLENKQIPITEDKYNTLYLGAESYIPTGLTPYQQRELHKKLALLAYVTNDFIDTDNTKLIYGTIPSDWEIIDL